MVGAGHERESEHEMNSSDATSPIAGEQRVAYTPVLPTPPDWWAEARIPLDDIQAPPEASS